MMPSESQRGEQTAGALHPKDLGRLAAADRAPVTALPSHGHAAADQSRHAPLLLTAEAAGPAWTATTARGTRPPGARCRGRRAPRPGRDRRRPARAARHPNRGTSGARRPQ